MSSAKQKVVRSFSLSVVFVVTFGGMIPAQPDTTVAPSFGDTTNLEIAPTMGSVEIDDLRDVPLIVIVVALAASVGLLLSSLGPRGLTVLTRMGDRGRRTGRR